MNEFAKSCISNKHTEGFNFSVNLTGTVFETCGDGLWSDAVAEIEVTEMGIYISTEEDGYDGDFFVLYDERFWNNDENGLIYTDGLFLKQTQTALKNALIAMGFEASKAEEIANSVDYSEQGMQDDGRVSFDAYELADALREFYADAVAA